MTTFPASVLTGATEDEAPATVEQMAAIEFDPQLTVEDVQQHGPSNADWNDCLAILRLSLVTVTKSKADLVKYVRKALDDDAIEIAHAFVEHAEQTIGDLETALEFIKAARARTLIAIATVICEEEAAPPAG